MEQLPGFAGSNLTLTEDCKEDELYHSPSDLSAIGLPSDILLSRYFKYVRELRTEVHVPAFPPHLKKVLIVRPIHYFDVSLLNEIPVSVEWMIVGLTNQTWGLTSN